MAKLISSPRTRQYRQTALRWKARLKDEAGIADVFINPCDPYSFVLLQALPNLISRFDIQLRFRTIWHQPDDMFPERAMWTNWAIVDATRLADLYGLEGPKVRTQPSEAKLVACRNHLLGLERSENYLVSATTAMKTLWHEGEPSDSGQVGTTNPELLDKLEKNEQRLAKLGHYQSSMLYFRGEWFWGVDRLDHLEQLLIREGRARQPEEEPVWNKTWATLGQQAKALHGTYPVCDTALEVFFSIRSPYSYLGLERAVRLTEAWNIPLRLRPVLPMMMRGQPVPNAKKWYIFQDTKREALKLGIPYGFVADPLGLGVERCYALFDYARSRGCEIEYMRIYGRAVNAEGIRSETDSGLKIIVERSGLDWQKARALLADQNWRTWAEDNRKAMYECGLWGVPSFRYGNINCWGQDRLWIIEDEIKKGKGGLSER
jgi:2-hydroxychromene-2-carboxylate isomerase